MSESNTNKNFVGRTKVISTQYGELVKIAFGPIDFLKFEELKKDGWCNLVMKRSAKTGEPYLVFDDFIPVKRENTTLDEARKIFPDSKVSIEDVPF